MDAQRLQVNYHQPAIGKARTPEQVALDGIAQSKLLTWGATPSQLRWKRIHKVLCFLGWHAPTFRYYTQGFLNNTGGWHCKECNVKFTRLVRCWGSANPSKWRQFRCWVQRA